MAETSEWRPGGDAGAAAVEHRGEATGLGLGKSSLVDTPASDATRRPAKIGHASRVQQLQRKQAQAGAASPDPTTAGATSPQVLVEDDVAAVAPGQAIKHDFIAQLKPLLEATAADELGPLYATAGCPYIAHYLAVYSKRPASECEAFIRKFTGSRANTAQGLTADLLARVRAGVRSWRESGQVPPEVAAAAGGNVPVAPPAAAAPSGLA